MKPHTSLQRSPLRSTTSATKRKRQITGQMQTARMVRFQTERAVLLEKDRHDIVVEPTENGLMVRFEGGDTHLCVSDWTPGSPLWGRHDQW